MEIYGETHDLWRAVDHEGEVLESYVTKKRDKSAALRFMKKALKRHWQPEGIVTDGLRSNPAAMRELGNLERREMGRYLNNRAENSHLPFRRRERAMLTFRHMKFLHKFLQSTPLCTTISIPHAISLIDKPSVNAARPHWPSGQSFVA